MPQLFAMSLQKIWPVAVAILHPNIGGWAGTFITRNNIDPWYKSLTKPSWEPPSWSFGVAWTIIYCFMGYSSLLILRSCGSWKKAALPLSIYALNLLLNWSWTPIFFGAHEIKWALYDLAAVWITTIVMSIVFYRIHPIAGSLILPYIAWNSLALCLNYSVYMNN